ncbi:MAG: DNA repair protein RecO [Cyclobacteriaceae bacterium]
MITKTKGIVLSHIPYGETSIIAKIYTEEFGYQGFIVNSVRSSKSKQGMAYFQPFTFLDLVIYMKSTRDLQRISEFKPIMSWYADSIKKQTILLFLAEVLDKLLRNEHESQPSLFRFLEAGLTFFKQAELVSNFHLQFLLKLSNHLGLDVMSGHELFQNMNRVTDQAELEALINALIAADFSDSIDSSGELRFHASEALIQFYHHHVPGFGQVQSLKVLRQIFR